MTNDNERMERCRNLLKGQLLQWMSEAGEYPTAIDGLKIFRRDQVDHMENCVLQPLATVVVQGGKLSLIGHKEYRYGAGSCLISGVDMPSTSYITSASPEEPYLSISIRLDRALIRQLAAELPVSAFATGHNDRGVSVAPVELDVFEAFLRLAELLEKPERMGVLAPLVIQEIHYGLLFGPQGGFLRQLNTPGSHSSQIALAVSWLRENFKEPLQVDELAERFNMSTSALHRHFKRVTNLSPLQYQKNLRLYEAQRLMLSQSLDANSASLAVGYESPYQFNREYRRLFGLPPFRDVKSKQQAAGSL